MAAKKGSDPGPGSYSPLNDTSLGSIKKPTTKKEAFKGSIFINNLKSTGLNLTTVPSIPSKSQLLVIHPQDYMNSPPDLASSSKG